MQPEHLPLADRQAGRFGARVLRVVPGTPAQKAGLQTDDVITHVNNAAGVRQELAVPGIEPTACRRDGDVDAPNDASRCGNGRRSVTASVVLSKKYVETSRPPFAQVKDPAWRGLRVEYPSALPPQLSTQGVQAVDPEGCVAVAEVDRDSPAWKAGLRRGEYISHVGTRRVSTPKEFYEAVAAAGGRGAAAVDDRRRRSPPCAPYRGNDLVAAVHCRNVPDFP